ncbi:hypothetical protein V1478_003005 [Vespula squamosa]|uniref:Uncharacterized protein n=1 Tax=Vespula squamosa TaxID=30214 RepID=A0ABD2BRG0_VESSQ
MVEEGGEMKKERKKEERKKKEEEEEEKGQQASRRPPAASSRIRGTERRRYPDTPATKSNHAVLLECTKKEPVFGPPSLEILVQAKEKKKLARRRTIERSQKSKPAIYHPESRVDFRFQLVFRKSQVSESGQDPPRKEVSLHLNSEPPIAIPIPWQVSTLYLILLHVSSCGFTWPSWAESSTVVLTTNRTFLLIEETLIEDIKRRYNEDNN